MTHLTPHRPPYIVGVGGTLRRGSSTERALSLVLRGAAAAGGTTFLIAGEAIDLPMYSPESDLRSAAARRLVEELRVADGIVLASPGYHGGVSGLVKNAIDYTEDLRDDARPYFEGRAVASVATGGGWQGAVATLNSLRAMVHALRGWNLPFGAALCTQPAVFGPNGDCLDEKLEASLMDMGRELVAFARRAQTPP